MAADLIGDETAAVVLQRDEERVTVVLLVRLTRLNEVHHCRRTYGRETPSMFDTGLYSVKHRPLTVIPRLPGCQLQGGVRSSRDRTRADSGADGRMSGGRGEEDSVVSDV